MVEEQNDISLEYGLILAHFGDRCALRSGIPLMNHIREGLVILEEEGASWSAKKAYCLHPLVQGDAELEQNLEMLAGSKVDRKVLMLALEYRRAANSFLCTPETDSWGVVCAKRHIGLLLPDIRHMLVADKKQNYKDFKVAHYGGHNRAKELEVYFLKWFEILGC